MNGNNTSHSESRLNVTSVGGESADNRVLFIHGFGADRQSWAGNVASVFKMAESLTVDLPGHGDAVSVVTGGSVAAIASNLLHSLVSDTPVHFVGHSVGASVAALCASIQPERVASLSLIAPAGLGGGVSREFVDRFVTLDNEADALELLQTLVHNERLIAPALASLLLNQLEQTGAREALVKFSGLLAGVESEMATAFSEIKELNIKRQFFWGRQDRINRALESDEKNMGGDWHWYDDTGHLLHVEQRVRFNRALSEFIKE